jgi:hypothetical protein
MHPDAATIWFYRLQESRQYGKFNLPEACLTLDFASANHFSTSRRGLAALPNLPYPWQRKWDVAVTCGNVTGSKPALCAELATEGFMSTADSFISRPLAIESLIVDRSTVLSLSRVGLVRRAGYKNIAKGLRRLDELLAGDLEKTRELIRALPAALDVPPELVANAIEGTRRQIAEVQEATWQAREAAWRAAFKPHAIILTERIVPQPIYVASIVGVERLLRIDFNIASPPSNYPAQALAGVGRRLSEFRIESGSIPDALPAFGRPIGVIVNCTPDNAIRFDLDGNALEILPCAHRLAGCHIAIRDRLLPLGPLASFL